MQYWPHFQSTDIWTEREITKMVWSVYLLQEQQNYKIISKYSWRQNFKDVTLDVVRTTPKILFRVSEIGRRRGRD